MAENGAEPVRFQSVGSNPEVMREEASRRCDQTGQSVRLVDQRCTDGSCTMWQYVFACTSTKSLDIAQ